MNTCFITYIKTNSKLTKDLNTTPEIIKYLKENSTGKLLQIRLSNYSMHDMHDMIPKSKGKKAKYKQLGVHQGKKGK